VICLVVQIVAADQRRLRRQLKADAMQLRNWGQMDYSLLLVVHWGAMPPVVVGAAAPAVGDGAAAAAIGSVVPLQWQQPLEYRFAIVDFFQKWTLRKKMERRVRGWCLGIPKPIATSRH
jgi:hypothetical protein